MRPESHRPVRFRPMLLEGSCHCRAVRFTVQSEYPIPYQRCYCSICRKAGGCGGYGINISADATTLTVEGRDQVREYRALIDRKGEQVRSGHRRSFCGECGSHLWAHHDKWPGLLHPVAGAIDTPLPTPPSHVHMMVGSKANWVAIEGKGGDPKFDAYPGQSIADWHRDHGGEVG